MEKEKCYLWMDSSHSPYRNMATDELLQDETMALGAPILRFYAWDIPSASFGYSQKPQAVTRQGLTLVRRPTGGGVVYHDCDLTYTFAIPAGNRLCELNRLDSYKVIHQGVMLALDKLGIVPHLEPDAGIKHDRATLQCFVSPSPNDVMASDGAKLAGAAQRRTRKGILHQGSISMATLPGRKLVISALKDAFAESLAYFYEDFQLRKELEEKINLLAEKKYSTQAWIERGEEPEA